MIGDHVSVLLQPWALFFYQFWKTSAMFSTTITLLLSQHFFLQGFLSNMLDLLSSSSLFFLIFCCLCLFSVGCALQYPGWSPTLLIFTSAVSHLLPNSSADFFFPPITFSLYLAVLFFIFLSYSWVCLSVVFPSFRDSVFCVFDLLHSWLIFHI